MAAETIAAPARPFEDFRRLVRLERFKLRRRPMPKILLAVLTGITFCIPWLFYLTLGGLGADPAGVDTREILDRLVFPDVLDASVENALSFGLPLLVVLTALAFGGEFAWGTIRLLLARGEGRGAYVASKLAAVAFWWLLALGVGTGAALIAGTLIAAVDGKPGPGSVDATAWAAFGGRFLVAWAASAAYAALTAFFAVQFRSTAIGLALGLGAYFGEGIVGAAAGSMGVPAFDMISRAGLGYNLRSLMGTLDGRENPALLAVAVLLMYGGAATFGAVWHLRRHDVVVAGVG